VTYVILFSDCPRDTVISPPNACQAGITLTCTSSSYPACTYQWIDNLDGGRVVSNDATYTLPQGQYDLTCRASMTAECTNGYYSPVPFPDGVTTEGFPFDGLLSRANANRTIDCQDSTTVTGFAIGK